MMESPVPSQHLKEQLRAEARSRRDGQENRPQLSRQIRQRLTALAEYSQAATVMLYVSFRSEVETHDLLAAACAAGKRVVVPYCVADRLELFRLESLAELAPGTMGILEPAAELRRRADRRIAAAEIDLVVAPGLAFDRRGGRIGYGKGYYDRLLREVRPDAAVVAVAFECQVFAAVPLLPHDVRMDKIVTEQAVYQRSGPRQD
jgi:5-formyltetrahydrofolate cyclo-ligase